MDFSWFKNLFKKKEPPVEVSPAPAGKKPELNIDMEKAPDGEKIKLISAQIEAMNERIKNIERMIEEIYKIAKS